jgi:hypothetical protein
MENSQNELDVTENKPKHSVTFLSSLIDDLSQELLVELLNYCAIHGHAPVRATIRAWRKQKGLNETIQTKG